MSRPMRMIRRASRVLPGVAGRSEAFEITVDPLRSLGGVRTMSKVLTEQNLNPNVLKLEYAVRGPLVIRAAEIQKEIDQVSSRNYVLNVNFALQCTVFDINFCNGNT